MHELIQPCREALGKTRCDFVTKFTKSMAGEEFVVAQSAAARVAT